MRDSQLKSYSRLKRAATLVLWAVSLCFAEAAACERTNNTSQASELRELRVISGPHQIDSYAVELLNRTIDKSHYRLKIIRMDVTQKRALEQLDRERSDIFWAPSTLALEKRLRAVYFPVFKGLLGYRLFLIPKNSQAKFSAINELADARKLIYGQMSSWTDSQILMHNDFKVLTTPTYHSLFPMLAKRRFDAVPRGIFEPWNEISEHKKLELQVEENLAFSYTLPFYFFVRKDEPALAQMLQKGLDAYLESGEFDRYLFEHELVKHNLERANLKNRKIFYLDNPELSEQTPLQKENYWYRVKTH